MGAIFTLELPTFEEIEGGGVLLSWGDVFGWTGLAFVLIGLPLVLAAALRPRWVWRLLIVVSIVGIGPLVKGYAVLDEVFTLLIVLGGMMVIALRGRRRELEGDAVDQFEEKRRWMFDLWTGYVVLQCMIGVMRNEDVRLIRWAIMYAMLAVLSRIVSRRSDFPFPSLRGAALIVLNTTILSYLVYLGLGLYFDSLMLDPGLLSEKGRFQFQHYVWSGSSSAVFPTLMAMPAALILLSDRSVRARGLAWSGIILMMLIGLYYDSLTSLLVLGGYALATLNRFTARHHVLIGLSFIVLFFVWASEPMEQIGDFAARLFAQVNVISPLGSDDVGTESRRLQLKGSVVAATDDLRVFLVGAGYYSHRFVLVPYMRQIWAESLPDEYYDRYKVVPGSKNDPLAITVQRTMALPALLVDTGIVGVALFAMNFVLAGIGVMKRGGPNRTLLAVALFIGFMWLIVSNILDIILLHLMIMPGGLIYQIGRAGIMEVHQPIEARPKALSSMFASIMGSEAR